MYIKNPKNAAQTSQDCEWDENVFLLKEVLAQLSSVPYGLT